MFRRFSAFSHMTSAMVCAQIKFLKCCCTGKHTRIHQYNYFTRVNNACHTIITLYALKYYTRDEAADILLHQHREKTFAIIYTDFQIKIYIFEFCHQHTQLSYMNL